MNSPYRDGCAKCVKLEAQLELALNKGLFPHQGGDKLKHHCVLCGETMYAQTKNHGIQHPNFALRSTADNHFCSNFEHTYEVLEGFLFWKKKKQYGANHGCPRSPHIHRMCWSCRGQWRERTAAQEKAFALLLETL